jgi:DNA-binding beta-propeller fold protein YncE
VKTFHARWWGILMAGISLMTCEEPEPYFNKRATPPEEYTLDILDIHDGQHLAGMVSFCYTPTLPVADISDVALFVDEQLVYATSGSVGGCYPLSLNTYDWPEGNHVVTIGIFRKQPPDHGLLNLAGVPSINYTASVVFDQTSPSPVTLESVTRNPETGKPILSWTGNDDLNFFGYIVYKEEYGSGVFLDTLYDQHTTSFADASHGEYLGIRCAYKVIVWNRASLAESNAVEFVYPSPVPITTDDQLGICAPIGSYDDTELFVLNSEGVRAIAKATNMVTRSFPMAGKYPQGFALSNDGTKLYVVSSYNPGLIVLDAATFDIIASADVEGFTGKNLVCGRADRLYVTTSWPGTLHILDAVSLDVVKVAGLQAPGGLLAISSDNNTLFVADPGHDPYQPATVYALDVTTDDPEILVQRTASDEIRDMELSADDETLFVIHDWDYPANMNPYVDCWSSTTFASNKQLSVPDQAFSLSVNAQTLCVVYGERYLNHWNPGGIMQYDLSSGSLLHEWKWKQAPYDCYVDANNTRVYALGSYSWVINLNEWP